MTFPLSRLMSAATASYAVYALASPRHLGNAVDSAHASDYDLLARTYGVRDLAVSTIGLFGRSDGAVTAAMLVRIACDVGDAALLASRTADQASRQKVLGVALGWGALNTLALLTDRRRR